MILVVCLASTVICPLAIMWNYIWNIFYAYCEASSEEQTISYLIVYSLDNANFALAHCIEDMCLLIISKDFRKLVKNQFVRNTQTQAVATTVYVSQVSQHQRNQQFNIQRNNLVN